jgi:hypothetical protein
VIAGRFHDHRFAPVDRASDALALLRKLTETTADPAPVDM